MAMRGANGRGGNGASAGEKETSTRDSIVSPLTPEEIASVRKPFRAANVLPSRTYHDPAIFDWEMEHWFARDWVWVGREEDAAEPGSFFQASAAGEPLLVVRGRDGQLRAFYNVCRHRGTLVVEEQVGKAVRFQCPYHAWVYDLDGSLVRAKHTEDLEDFDVSGFGLAPVRLDTWQGFVFVNLDPEAAPLERAMGDWSEHHKDHDFGRLRRVHRITYEVRANWKIVAENYSECYHCPGVHPLLNKWTPYDLGEDFFPDGPWKGGWMPLAAACETMSMDGTRQGRPLLDGTNDASAQRIYYYILWPNLILSLHPDYLITHNAIPLEPGLTRVHWDIYVDRDSAGQPGFDLSGAIEFWDLTNRQDYHVVELQQTGTASRSFRAGRYSNQEASVHAFDIMAIDRYAMDGTRTRREARTEAGRARR